MEAQKADDVDAQTTTDADVFAAERDGLSGVDSLADTKWSALFHAARTANSMYNGVAVPVRVTDENEIEVGDVVKTRQGEHYNVRNAPRWDTTVSIGTRAFMTVDEGAQWIRQELRRRSFGAQ